MELPEISEILKRIHAEYYRTSTSTSIGTVAESARIVKELSIKVLGEEDEVTGEMESVIVLSKNFKYNSNYEKEDIYEAILHLKYGIELFLEKI